MNLKILGVSFVCLLVAAGLFIGLHFEMKKIDYIDRNDENKCEKDNKTTEGSDCGAWQSFGNSNKGQCRKGTVKSGKCVAKGTPWPLVMGISGSLFAVTFAVTFITGLLMAP